MITELESITSREGIRKLLRTLGFLSRNLLQSAAQQNTCLELHEILWENLEKYFDESEILQFCKHRDDFGCNVLLNVTISNTKEIKELTWNKAKKVLKSNGYEDNKCDEIMKKNLKFEQLSKEENEILSLEWINITNSVELCEDRTHLIITQTIDVESLKELELFIADKKIENHQILWEKLKENYQNKKKLKKLILEKNRNDNNYIHLLVIYNNPDIIEFTINKFKKHLTDSDYQKNLRSKGFSGRNLLHTAAVYSKEVKTHQILWKTFRDSCKSCDAFLEILRETDENGMNIFNYAACFVDRSVGEFVFEKLEKILKGQIKSFLNNLNIYQENILQMAARYNKSLEVHKYLWQKIQSVLNPPEILEFINNYGINGHHLLHYTIFGNTKDIIEFTWSKIQIYISNKDDQIEYLTKLSNKKQEYS
ncbi:uncharacterized protein [Chironomus tepperi]|uniref:uncharacterized protein n=1 Tax=Chironomus tepperi TaxID=113505 RepID=UPI00391EE417